MDVVKINRIEGFEQAKMKNELWNRNLIIES